MNKIYAFIVIIPLVALLFIKSIAFYEYDTKQRYIKNEVDSAAHKVMITGVMTVADKDNLLKELKKLGDFEAGNIILKYGSIQSDGSVGELYPYTPGSILDRGWIFSIYVQSRDESTLSKVEGDSASGGSELYYKAKATCRIEKKQPAN